MFTGDLCAWRDTSPTQRPSGPARVGRCPTVLRLRHAAASRGRRLPPSASVRWLDCRQPLVKPFTRQVRNSLVPQQAPPDGPQQAPSDTADVIVVGAGPAGSAAAYYLASAGLDVLVLEKSQFPREKVCGDGLTPRAVKALTSMGIRTGADDGWVRNQGLRVIGGGYRAEVPWPDLSSFPAYGLVRTRLDFDQMLVRHAEKAGARVEQGFTVTGPVL